MVYRAQISPVGRGWHVRTSCEGQHFYDCLYGEQAKQPNQIAYEDAQEVAMEDSLTSVEEVSSLQVCNDQIMRKNNMTEYEA